MSKQGLESSHKFINFFSITHLIFRLINVQKDLKQLLPSDAILVGQSLNSDLAAMRMLHPYVIDTSVIYNLSGDRKKKTKLSVLSEMFLGEKIQRESRRGHSPEEDAIAAM